MKRVFLIHGWAGYPEEGWRPWLKEKLEKEGFHVSVPAMPDTAHPKMEAWVEHLTKIVGVPDQDCYFIGHSLGCITILRYLETLEENQKVGGVILVAGFSDDLGYQELSSFFAKLIDWEKIKSVCSNFVIIHSTDDPLVPVRYADILKEKLNAEVIIEQNKKHFSGDDGIMELPSAFESILKFSND
ncbi:MAG: alpha/beta fold hydrolase [Patescibacteria group bacterium]